MNYHIKKTVKPSNQDKSEGLNQRISPKAPKDLLLLPLWLGLWLCWWMRRLKSPSCKQRKLRKLVSLSPGHLQKKVWSCPNSTASIHCFRKKSFGGGVEITEDPAMAAPKIATELMAFGKLQSGWSFDHVPPREEGSASPGLYEFEKLPKEKRWKTLWSSIVPPTAKIGTSRSGLSATW